MTVRLRHGGQRDQALGGFDVALHVALESDSKGYRFKLTPPIPVNVLEGDVKGDAKAIKHLVPLAAVP